MTSSAAPETSEASAPSRPRTQQVAPFEPLAVPGEPTANLVDLIHRSALANWDRTALQWKLPRSRRKTGGEAETEEQAGWHSTT